MHSSVAESWSILDLAAEESPLLAWSLCLSVDLHRKHLFDCLDGIVESVQAGSLYYSFSSVDVQSVCFCRKRLVEKKQESVALGCFNEFVMSAAD